MNDESKQLERRLEQATARQLPADTPLDSETAALREGWLALGQLLEAAESAAGPAAPLPAIPPTPAPRSWKWLGRVVALAASLLVAGVVAWQLFPGSDSGQHAVKTPEPAPTPQLVQTPEPALAPEKNQVAGQPGQQPKPAQESWDGTLDESITQAYQDLISIEQDWTGFNSMSASVSTKLEEISQELAQNTI